MRKQHGIAWMEGSVTLRDDLPQYPPLLQLLRVTGGTVPGPSGYMSSSALGPSLYVAFTQQLHTGTLLPRDREPCLVLDVNNAGLSPGYYLGRLAGTWTSLPVYEVVGVSPMMISGLTPAQQAVVSTLSPAQQTVLDNLTPCQLQTLLTALPTSQIHTLTSGVLTPTQLSNLVNFSTPAELTALYTRLTTSQVITLTSTLNQTEVYSLVSVLTPAQIQTLITSLTSIQLQTLTTLAPAQILDRVTNLTTAQLQTYLNTIPLDGVINTSESAVALITTETFSGVSQVDINLPAGYTYFKIIATDLQSSAATSVLMRTSTDGGATFDSAGTDYVTPIFSAPQLTIVTAPVDSGSVASSFEMTAYNLLGTTMFKMFDWTAVTGSPLGVADSTGYRASTNDVDALRFFVSSGTFEGIIKVYGYN